LAGPRNDLGIGRAVHQRTEQISNHCLVQGAWPGSSCPRVVGTNQSRSEGPRPPNGGRSAIVVAGGIHVHAQRSEGCPRLPGTPSPGPPWKNPDRLRSPTMSSKLLRRVTCGHRRHRARGAPTAVGTAGNHQPSGVHRDNPLPAVLVSVLIMAREGPGRGQRWSPSRLVGAARGLCLGGRPVCRGDK
jgi:hypothetical protein